MCVQTDKWASLRHPSGTLAAARVAIPGNSVARATGTECTEESIRQSPRESGLCPPPWCSLCMIKKKGSFGNTLNNPLTYHGTAVPRLARNLHAQRHRQGVTGIRFLQLTQFIDLRVQMQCKAGHCPGHRCRGHTRHAVGRQVT